MKKSFTNISTVKNFALFCLIFFFLFAITGCDEGGDVGDPCYEDGTCDNGLVCIDDICVDEDDDNGDDDDDNDDG